MNPGRSVREVAATLRERLGGSDALVWQALRRDGEVQPWTPAAERAFGGTAPYEGSDDRLRHSRAVCLHTRAYDLQRAGRPAQALPYWRAALRDWVALHACDAFWVRLAERMPPIDRRPIAQDVIDAVRRALPGRLLDVHVSLARSLRAADPELAAEHATLIRESGFPAEAVATAREALFVGLDVRVAVAIEQRKVGPLFDEVVEWLRIDPLAPQPAHLMVALADGWAWRLWSKDNGWTAVGNMISRVLQVLPLTGPGFAALAAGDKARLVYWRGLHRRYGTALPRVDDDTATLRQIRKANERAERHLREAMYLSADVRLHPWVVEEQIAEAISVQALCARFDGRDNDARRLAGDALVLHPENKRAIGLRDQLKAGMPAADPTTSQEVSAAAGDRQLAKLMAHNEIRAIDRMLDRDEPELALEQLEFLEQTRTGESRPQLADHPAVVRLGAVVARHAERRRRYNAVTARLRANGGPS